MKEKIKVGDIVKGSSGLFFKCENKKQERWMNFENSPFIKATIDEINSLPKTYFGKFYDIGN